MSTVSAIIVSFNTREMTLRCVEAVLREVGEVPVEVFVVDNASTDGSVEAIRERFPRVRVIEGAENRGFGAANNLALREAAGEFLLLVNSDAFLRPGAVRAMVGCARAHPRAGVVGPRLLNWDGSLQRSCYKFPSPGRAWAENLWLHRLYPDHPVLGDYERWGHDQEREVEWVSGACMLVRRQAYEEVGGFDERFFMYAEETDWQKRMRAAGWAVWFTPAGEVVHLGGGSGGEERQGEREVGDGGVRINRVMFESLDRYELKHHGVGGLVLFRGAMVVGSLMRGMGWLGVYLLGRKRRGVAWGKVRLHWWLVWRQMFCWGVRGSGLRVQGVKKEAQGPADKETGGDRRLEVGEAKSRGVGVEVW
jgi:GT2 family glycosyltransferase